MVLKTVLNIRSDDFKYLFKCKNYEYQPIFFFSDILLHRQDPEQAPLFIPKLQSKNFN